ncbi:Deoxyribonuclease-2-alpha [Trichinella pseudospiralis]|uniref:Deoxyribonuclease-2-alpha n=1 Tax=Trichinella pseudospiralis TaxID=6337 RepID=A0A0V0YK36_TRIPS|nr:Deoxyribonuclease-2-alpha [Trichinella pseudospiralis]
MFYSMAIVYKAPGQANGKIIEATAAAAWQNGAQPLINNEQHSFATALQHVVADNNNVKFLAYNNAPPGVPSIKTKSNSKGVIILATNADSAAWIVHTVPGFPAAKTGYSWPTETAALPYFNKLAEGKIPTLPPFTSRLTIRTQDGASPVTVHIYSKSESSKYEIYKKVIVRVLKKTIKVWSKRDNRLKGDCRGSQRHIRLIKSPAVVVDHNTNLEADITNWAVSDPGNIFCHIDKPYLKNQAKEPAMAVCIENNDIFARFDAIAAQIYHILKQQNVKIEMVLLTAIVYKAPGQANGKIIEATAAGAWQNGAQALSSDNGHSFAKTLEHVVGNNNNVKFLAYNNAPPGVPSIKTKSNSKGVIILATNADSAAWIVHTVPGFPAAKTGYSWPTETAALPYFNKLAEGKIPTLPPFTSRLTIRTQDGASPVTVHIYSKSESSKYEIYKKVIVRVLKKTIKVWSKRDNRLKGDCRGSQRHIRLIKSPAVVVDHNTNLEADITNWAVSDPGNIFCHIDKPYLKNQAKEPAMAA